MNGEEDRLVTASPPLLPRIVLHDDRDRDASLFGLTTKLIDPFNAVKWIAHGHFENRDVVRDWFFMDDDTQDREAAISEGREDAAQELLTAAIVAGRVRCVYVSRVGKRGISGLFDHVVEAIPPSQFEGHVEQDWEEGFSLHIGSDTHAYSRTVSGFSFIWDEVLALRPEKVEKVERTGGEPDRMGYNITPLPHAIPAPIASNRGSRPKNHGAPLALFLASCIRDGGAALLAEKDEELGRRLQGHYQAARSLPIPSLRNAASDARSALEAWFSADGGIGRN